MTGSGSSASGIAVAAGLPHDGDDPVTVFHAAGSAADLLRLTSIVDALRRRGGIRQVLVHSGRATRHPDPCVAVPDQWLGIGSGTHGERTALMLHRFEQLLQEHAPHVVVVCGASDAALACALAAAKDGIAVVHVESGLRSSGSDTPRDLNRVLTDRLADTLLTPTRDAAANLVDEGIPDTRICAIGNTAIDLVVRHEHEAHDAGAWRRHAVEEGRYVLALLRRPTGPGAPGRRAELVEALTALAGRQTVVLSLPHGISQLVEDDAELDALRAAGVRIARPDGYLEHLSLETGAGAIVTDLGAVQDEASALGIPCFTVAGGTDRPATVAQGTNVLLGDEPAAIAGVRPARHGGERRAIALWDGRAGERAAARVLAHHVLLGSLAL